MGEAKFTKGEWVKFYPHEIDLNVGYVSVESVEGKLIYLTKTYKRTLEEDTANAHLIAAAPEMYNVLEELIEVVDDCFWTAHINQLLAKARGES